MMINSLKCHTILLAKLLGTMRIALIKDGGYTRKEAVEMTTALLVATLTRNSNPTSPTSAFDKTFQDLIKKGQIQ